MIKLIIFCLNVSFKKLIVRLQLHPKLIASDYITTGRPLGRTKGVHSCVTPQGAWGDCSEAWLANPSSLTYFNTNGRVSGLGKTSWYGTGYDNTAYVEYMDLAVRCSRKAVKLNHSLTHSLQNSLISVKISRAGECLPHSLNARALFSIRQSPAV